MHILRRSHTLDKRQRVERKFKKKISNFKIFSLFDLHKIEKRKNIFIGTTLKIHSRMKRKMNGRVIKWKRIKKHNISCFYIDIYVILK